MRAGGPLDPTGDGRLFGVYYAVVTQNKDDENKARVKIRLPWLDKGDTDQTYWASTSTPMSGNQFGWYTLPDIDDVVAVMFIAGDVTRPVVLGGVWSKTDSPAEKNEGDNDFRGYKSRTGARVILDDSSNGKVVMSDKTDHNELVIGSMDKGGSGSNARGGSKCQGGASSGLIAASMQGTMDISCGDGKLSVEGTNVEVSADDKLDINSATTLDLKGATVTMASSGAFKAEGATVNIG